MSSRIESIFRRNGKCFIPFVTAGHPDLEVTKALVLSLAEAGSHIIEIGIPFSDPIADGPVIQKSSFEALRHGYSMEDYLQLVREVRPRTEAGLVFMTYMNPLIRYGMDRFEKEAVEAGLDGLLISDLTADEAECSEGWLCHSLDRIFLAAPTSSDERLKRISRLCTGFLYLVARTGVTGRRSEIGETLVQSVARVRRCTDLPVAVGFGITSAQDVQRIWRYADGAVVGSALVQYIEENRAESDLARKVGEFVKKRLIPERG